MILDIISLCVIVYSNSDDTTPVLTAASYGHCKALKLLIAAGGDVGSNVCDCEGNNALDLAWQSRCTVCYNIVREYSSTFMIMCNYILYAFNKR